MDEFERFRIKTYHHWELYLHKNQYPYIGRCYAWARRQEASSILDITSDESLELFSIVVPEWNNAVKELYNHDWPNLAILGNETPHLHAHLIPRYHTPRIVDGTAFIDPNPKGNYSPYERREISIDTLLQIWEGMIQKF